jgi:arsenate reductase
VATTIYHNPACSTSRAVLGLIGESGTDPAVVEYLKTPPDRGRLLEMLAQMGLTARGLLRRKGTPYLALGLDDPALPDDVLIDAMLTHPILIERPIVVGPGGVRLCRPIEKLQEALAGG